MTMLKRISMLLVAIGALNWGLMALWGLNLVNMLLGGFPSVEMLAYVLVGLSGAWMLVDYRSWWM